MVNWSSRKEDVGISGRGFKGGRQGNEVIFFIARTTFGRLELGRHVFLALLRPVRGSALWCWSMSSSVIRD